MDPILAEYASKGILVFSMAIVIGVLYRDNSNLRKENNAYRDSAQSKIETVNKQATDAINAAVTQTLLFDKTLDNMMGVLTQYGQQLTALKDEISRLARGDK